MLGLPVARPQPLIGKGGVATFVVWGSEAIEGGLEESQLNQPSLLFRLQTTGTGRSHCHKLRSFQLSYLWLLLHSLFASVMLTEVLLSSALIGLSTGCPPTLPTVV